MAANALEEAQLAVKMTDENILNYQRLDEVIRQSYPVQEMESIGRYGLKIGMEREEIMAFLKMGSTSGLTRKTLKELEEVMEKWVATKRSGIPWGFSNPEHFDQFKQFVKSGIDNTNYKDTKVLLQGSSVKGISYELKIPFGAHSDLDIALAGRTLFERAQKLASDGLIGPASANPTKFLLKDGDEAIKILGLDSLHNSLRQSAGRNVDFMLFRSEHNAREYARRSVGPNSVELN
jgi:hypothetical protein